MSKKRFAPNDAITREQICVIFYNHAGKTSDKAVSFKDAAQVSSWAKKGVAYCADTKIINGYPDGTFRPKANITRAEMATMTLSYVK